MSSYEIAVTLSPFAAVWAVLAVGFTWAHVKAVREG